MEATTTAAARSMAGYNFVLALLGWAIFWTVLIREICVRTHLRAAPVVAASAPTPPPPPAADPEPAPDEEEIEQQPRPAAQFTDEVMAAIMEQARAEVKLLTDPQMLAARPAPVAPALPDVKVDLVVICPFCRRLELEMSEQWPTRRLGNNVSWRVCAHHKRARQQVKDTAVARGVFPTQLYFCDVPRRCELN